MYALTNSCSPRWSSNTTVIGLSLVAITSIALGALQYTGFVNGLGFFTPVALWSTGGALLAVALVILKCRSQLYDANDLNAETQLPVFKLQDMQELMNSQPIGSWVLFSTPEFKREIDGVIILKSSKYIARRINNGKIRLHDLGNWIKKPAFDGHQLFMKTRVIF